MIFRYPGGKSRDSVQDKILRRFPSSSSYSEFRDAMVGGGGIFFAVDIGKKRWINDKDEDLISVYRALQDRPKEFIAKCREIKPAQKGEPLAPAKPGGKSLYNARLKAEFDRFAANENDEDPALRYLFVQRTVWAGRVNYDIPSRMYFSNPQGWNIVFSNKMERAAEAVMGVRITCGNYHDAIFEDGEGVLVYLDPPYYVNTELAKNSRLYKHNFEKKDHDDLFDAVKQCRHKVIISYDDHPYIRGLYERGGFNIGEEKWTYCGTSSVVSDGQSATKKIGKELVITNF